MTMRVLHIVPSYIPAYRYGGPIQSVHLLNKRLSEIGVAIDVYTTNAGLENRNDILINRWVDLDGTRVKYFNYYGYEHYTFSPRLFFESLKEADSYDLVHITAVWNFPVLAGSIASLLRKKPYVISTRGAIYEKAVNLKSKNKKLLYYHLAAQHYLKRASALHFTTKDEREKVLSYLKLDNKSVVIPNGIDLSLYHSLPPEGIFREKYPLLKDKKYILFLGRITPIKGLDILINAFKEISRVDPDIVLVIAGPDAEGYGKEVKGLLHEYGIFDRVLFTGMLTGDDKLSAYRDADIFVLSSYSENFGMSVVEAMACGKPVIISDKVGIHQEVEQNRAGIIVEANSGSLFKGLKMVLGSEELRKELSLNAKKMVEEYYDIDKVADKMRTFYESFFKG